MKLRLFFFFFLILGFLSFSQTTPDRFIVHKVKKKETLYSLSKIYNISIETIKEYNPLIDKIGLKRKMKLQIPIFKNKPSIEDKPVLVNYKRHVVKPKETKWRLAYEYGLKISELEKINPEIVSGLKIGQQILLPSGKDTVINNFQNELNYYQVKSNENLSLISQKIGISTDSIIAYNPILINSLPEEETILKIPSQFNGNFDVKDGLLYERISLKDSFFSNNYLQLVCFLPFKIREIEFDSVEKTNTKLSKRNLHTISSDFYFGMEMAKEFCDSIGIKTKIKVIDTQNDLSVINEKISSIKWEGINAIIGPLIPKNFDFFSKNSQISDIPIISPLSTKEIAGEKNVFQSVGRLKRLRKVMMNYIKNQIDTTQNLLVITDSINFKVANQFKNTFPDAHFVESEKKSLCNDSTRWAIFGLLNICFPGPGNGSDSKLQVSRMTFFIQTCPCCGRRFDLPVRSLGSGVQCRFCESIFRATDHCEDAGEASDRMDCWAREKKNGQVDSEAEEPISSMRPR